MSSIKPKIDQTVRPLLPVEPRVYPLSTIDQYVPKKWIERLMYFSLSEDVNFEEVYLSLKASLTHIITMYPLLTGMVCRNPEKQHYVAVQTSSDPEVTFFFKDHTKEGSSRLGGLRLPSYALLKELGYPMQGIMEFCSPELIFTEISEGSAMFSAQANFVKGGLVLALVFNHLLIDGGIYNEFTRLWADFTANGAPSTPQIVEYDEVVVKRLSTGQANGKLPDPRLWIMAPAEKSGLRMPPPGTPASGIVHPRKKGADSLQIWSQIMIWTIAPDKQKLLKEYASAYSTMNAIFAMLWSRNVYHSRYKAKGLNTAYARMPIDMRSRMQPPVKASYLGNTVNILAMEVATDSISENTQATVQLFAQTLRDSINASSRQDVEAFIDTANSLPAEKGLAPPFPGVFAPCTLLNDHSKMQMHEFDWGRALGKMDRLRDPLDDVPIRNLSMVQCYPRLPDGTLELCTLFDLEVLQKLEEDEEFLRYFQPYSRAQLEV